MSALLGGGKRNGKWLSICIMLVFSKVYKSWQFAKNEQYEYHELYATIFH
jgi:hypothetical protein